MKCIYNLRLNHMDIALMSDTYTLSIDMVGNYIDNLPILTHGFICLCGKTNGMKRLQNLPCMSNQKHTKSG